MKKLFLTSCASILLLMNLSELHGSRRGKPPRGGAAVSRSSSEEIFKWRETIPTWPDIPKLLHFTSPPRQLFCTLDTPRKTYEAEITYVQDPKEVIRKSLEREIVFVFDGIESIIPDIPLVAGQVKVDYNFWRDVYIFLNSEPSVDEKRTDSLIETICNEASNPAQVSTCFSILHDRIKNLYSFISSKDKLLVPIEMCPERIEGTELLTSNIPPYSTIHSSKDKSKTPVQLGVRFDQKLLDDRPNELVPHFVKDYITSADFTSKLSISVDENFLKIPGSNKQIFHCTSHLLYILNLRDCFLRESIYRWCIIRSGIIKKLAERIDDLAISKFKPDHLLLLQQYFSSQELAGIPVIRAKKAKLTAILPQPDMMLIKTDSLNQIRAQSGKLMEENQVLSEKLRLTEQRSEEEKKALQKSILDLQKEIQGFEAQIKNFSQRESDLLEQKSNAEGRIKDLETQIKSLKEDQEKRAKIEQEQKEIVDLRSRIPAMQAQIDELKKQLEDNQKRFERAEKSKSAFQNFQKENAQLKAQNDILEKKLEEMKVAEESSFRQFSSLRSKNQALDKENQGLRDQLTASTKKVSELEAIKEDKDKAIAGLKEHLKEARTQTKSRSEEFEKQFAELTAESEKRIAELAANFEHAQKEKEELTAVLAEKDRIIAESQARADELAKAREADPQTMTAQQTALAEKDRAIADQQAEIERLRAESAQTQPARHQPVEDDASSVSSEGTTQSAWSSSSSYSSSNHSVSNSPAPEPAQHQPFEDDAPPVSNSPATQPQEIQLHMPPYSYSAPPATRGQSRRLSPAPTDNHRALNWRFENSYEG